MEVAKRRGGRSESKMAAERRAGSQGKQRPSILAFCHRGKLSRNQAGQAGLDPGEKGQGRRRAAITTSQYRAQASLREAAESELGQKGREVSRAGEDSPVGWCGLPCLGLHVQTRMALAVRPPVFGYLQMYDLSG